MSYIEENGKDFFEANFRNCGCKVRFVKGVSSPLGDTYFFDYDNVLQYDERRLKDIIKKMSIYSHKDIRLTNTKEAHFALFMMNENATPLQLSQCIFETQGKEIAIGKDEKGQMVCLDFQKIPHLLIAGTTGSGKSVLLHNIITNLHIAYGNHKHVWKDVAFVIVDPKGNELDIWKQSYNVQYIDETQEAIRAVQLLEQEMDKRYRENKYDYDLFFIVDEFADLMLTSKYAVEKPIIRIAQKGRACGIHLIIATQRPTIDVVSGLIKANMPYRIGLKTASVRDSIVILDHKGLETLRGCGDCIVKLGLHEYHTQIAYPERSVIDKVIAINRG